MDRRKFSAYVVSGAFLGIAGGGYYWLNAPRDHAHLALDAMLDKLDGLTRAPLSTTGRWDAGRVFHHLAQSVEFSMSGFPQHKSPLFQRTVGRLAFKAFNARGQMNHGLSEAIPGEVIHRDVDPGEGLLRLKTALQDFRAHDAGLKPHFAYGALSHDEYAIAHALHINNHLEEFNLT